MANIIQDLIIDAKKNINNVRDAIKVDVSEGRDVCKYYNDLKSAMTGKKTISVDELKSIFNTFNDITNNPVAKIVAFNQYYKYMEHIMNKDIKTLKDKYDKIKKIKMKKLALRTHFDIIYLEKIKNVSKGHFEIAYQEKVRKINYLISIVDDPRNDEETNNLTTALQNASGKAYNNVVQQAEAYIKTKLGEYDEEIKTAYYDKNDNVITLLTNILEINDNITKGIEKLIVDIFLRETADNIRKNIENIENFFQSALISIICYNNDAIHLLYEHYHKDGSDFFKGKIKELINDSKRIYFVNLKSIGQMSEEKIKLFNETTTKVWSDTDSRKKKVLNILVDTVSNIKLNDLEN